MPFVGENQREAPRADRDLQPAELVAAFLNPKRRLAPAGEVPLPLVLTREDPEPVTRFQVHQDTTSQARHQTRWPVMMAWHDASSGVSAGGITALQS
jgi:hypothetical protein